MRRPCHGLRGFLIISETDCSLITVTLILCTTALRMASNHGAVAHLLPQNYKRQVAAWLEEDCPSFDYGGFVVGEEMGEARLLGKSKVGWMIHIVGVD